MKVKNNSTFQSAPVDLTALSRYQLAVFVSSLKRNALKVVLAELAALENGERQEVEK